MDNIYALNIERAVLSAMLFDYDIVGKVIDTIKSKDLYLPAHQIVFQTMADLFKEDMPIDEDFIRKRISQKDVSDSVLIEILSTNSISNVMAYVQEIRESSKKRELNSIATEIKKLTIESDISANEISDSIKTKLDNLDDDIENVEDFCGQSILNTHFESIPSYMTGIKAIDDELGGVENGQLIYVTGLEETGKTHITYKIMENISYSRKVGIVSLEFGKQKLKNRLANMIKNNHQINPSNIKASFECHNIIKLEKIIKKWHKEGVNFGVIDSINLIENHSINDRWERVLNIGTRLFKLVQQLNITLFVISTSTKQDNKDGNPSIYGGQLLNNYCDQKWHIFRDLETEDRMLWINKNKQNYKYPKIDLNFDKNGGIFGKNEIRYNNIQPQVTIYKSDDLIEVHPQVDIPDIF